MKQLLFDNLKNVAGWKTSRKIIVFSVDDYGNIRLNSKKARENLDKAGLKVLSRFDAYDTLETRNDLEALYEVLSGVKDKNGNSAVFTPYTLPCNINFEAMAAKGNEYYIYESLPETFNKLSLSDPQSYEGAWALWREGIDKGLMKPQFHGREHFNLKVFEEKLKNKDKELLINLQNRSYTSISSSGYSSIGYTAAFAFHKEEDYTELQSILEDGTDQFEKVFGFRSDTFTPPAQQFPIKLLSILQKYGIKSIDIPFHHKVHLGENQYKLKVNVTGVDEKLNIVKIVRNVIFEPTHGNTDHVGHALKQIKAAFRWNKPAIISSHRVNYCGYIDENNRKKGLNALQKLLSQIVKVWPDVEFMSADELGKLIALDQKKNV